MKASDVAAMDNMKLPDGGSMRRYCCERRGVGDMSWNGVCLEPAVSNPSPLELEEVVFGIRCKLTVKC